MFSLGSAEAFNVPERFEFDLKWTGIKAGSSVIDVSRFADDKIVIVSTAKSADWISVFYPVEDNVESILTDGETRYPLNYRIKLKEGSFRRDREYVFDRDLNRAKYIDHAKNEEWGLDVPEDVFDPLSAFFNVRDMELVVGKSVYVRMFDNKKIWNVEVKVIKKEKVEVPAGTFDTIMIRPLMESGGIFKSKGPVYIWLSDDEKKIPVKFKSSVAVGSITAVLTGGKW